ncbi:MAG: FkbM family methyltransferase [Vicinamibacterales bacterium]
MRNSAYVAAQRVYAAGLRACYSRTGMPWQVHDETVRIDPTVRHLVPHASEAALFAFIKRHVTPGDVVFDVGSFLGVYAVLEARIAGPRGRVVAIEPTTRSASIARRHFAFNADRASAPVYLVEAATGEQCRQTTFYEYEEPYVNALTPAVDVNGRARTRVVQVVTIDDLCDQMRIRPAFIRMDVQGAEFDALRGARRTIAAAGPGLTIVAEMHPQCWPSFGIDEAHARHTIDTLGLSAEPLEPGTDLFARDGHIVLRPRHG